jgi:uncharacterized protein YegP (UPF0339 family)
MLRLNRFVITAVVGWTFVCAGALAVRSAAAPAAGGDEKVRAKFEVYKDRGGEFRWRLRATNTQILATSGDGYKSKRDCMSAIESVKRDVANAPVEDTTEGAAATGGADHDGQAKPPAEKTPTPTKRPAR